MFDTLTYANKLKEAGFTERQAQAQAEALVAVVDSNLATKQNLKELELRLSSETKVSIAEAKADIIKWCVGSVFASVGLFAALVKLIG